MGASRLVDVGSMNQGSFSRIASFVFEIQAVCLSSFCLAYVYLLYIAYKLILKTAGVGDCVMQKTDDNNKCQQRKLQINKIRRCHSAPNLCHVLLEDTHKYETSNIPTATVMPSTLSKAITCQDDGGTQTSTKKQDEGADTTTTVSRLQQHSYNREGVSAGGAGDGGDDEDNDKGDKKKKPLPPDDFKNEATEEKEDCLNTKKNQSDVDEPMEVSSDEASDISMKSVDQDEIDTSVMPSQIPIPLGNQQLYEIKVLGEGSFGTCILVQNKSSGNLHALKKICKDKFESSEVYILRKLQGSQNIIKLHEMQSYHDMVYLLFEFAQGGTLKEFLSTFKNNPCFSHEQEVIQLFGDIMCGMAYCHEKLIIHADIKSENILMVSRGGASQRAVLADFGLAIDTTSQAYNLGTLTARGTPRYLSPEMIKRNQMNSFASDVWSCGCVLMEIDTGDPPWKQAEHLGNPGYYFMIGMANKPPIPDNRPPLLQRLYEATLCLDPSQRLTAFQILHEVIQ